MKQQLEGMQHIVQIATISLTISFDQISFIKQTMAYTH